MKILWAQDFAPYHKKYVAPYVDMALMAFSFMANLGALCVIVGGVLEFGFELTNKLIRELDLVYFWAWSMFLIERVGRIILTKPGKRKSAFSFLGWIINGLLMLTLIPIIVEFFKIDHNIGLISILGNREAHLLILFLIAFIEISNTVITSMGRKTNPALAMAVSFMFIILAGSGLLLMPRCIQPGVHLSWIDSLFTATSAVCVTGLTTIDVPSTFTSFGQMVIIMLIQVGGLGIMTITSFFALFFMSNTSIYSQMLVRDNIHGTIGLDLRHELFFSVFHSVSAFCNAGFSNYPDGMSAPELMVGGHCWLYVILSLLIILGGIGYPVLVNMKAVVTKRARLIWRWLRGRRYASLSIPNLYDLNTKIVLKTTAVLIVSGTVLIAFFEWDNTFAGMQTHEKLTQAFFNAVSPRTAGFISVNLNSMCLQSIFIYTLLMWIGGASQSTAGGVKVNAFAVAILNIRSILRGSDRVEFAGREVSTDSIRRANAAVIVSVVVLSFFVFLVTLTDPDLPLKAIVFECVSAFATVGSSLGITSQLQDASKVLLVVLMFIGRVGVVTLAQGLLKQYKNQNYYKLPQDNITIS